MIIDGKGTLEDENEETPNRHVKKQLLNDEEEKTVHLIIKKSKKSSRPTIVRFASVKQKNQCTRNVL